MTDRSADRFHFDHVLRSWPAWYPGKSEDEARAAIFEETEALRFWYRDGMVKRKHDPPYRRAARGYVAAYMQRGYGWLGAVCAEPAGLRNAVLRARRVLVEGCGPAPELFGLVRHLPQGAEVVLADAAMDVWRPFITEFTVPLVRQTIGFFSLMKPVPVLDLRSAIHGTTPGPFDLVVAQLVLNEIATRPVSGSVPHVPLSANTAVRRWFDRVLRPGGAVVVFDTDTKDRRLEAVERSLDIGGRCVRGAIPRSPRFASAGPLRRWLSGPWGPFLPRTRASVKYLAALRTPAAIVSSGGAACGPRRGVRAGATPRAARGSCA